MAVLSSDAYGTRAAWSLLWPSRPTTAAAYVGQREKKLGHKGSVELGFDESGGQHPDPRICWMPAGRRTTGFCVRTPRSEERPLAPSHGGTGPAFHWFPAHAFKAPTPFSVTSWEAGQQVSQKRSRKLQTICSPSQLWARGARGNVKNFRVPQEGFSEKRRLRLAAAAPVPLES